MNWISTYQWQIAMVIAVCIVLGVGRAAILPIVKSSTLALWVAFAVTAFCGLVLCWALFGVMQWVTALPSLAGAVVGSIGAIIALWAGWHAASMIVPLARDVIDKRPDEDARKAALWVPTLLPAGFNAVWGVISHPRGITSTVTGAIMAGITILYAHRIVKAALAGRAGARGWRWFATLPMLLAGIVMIPLLAFADAQASQRLTGSSAAFLIIGRIALGSLGFALIIALIKDMKDKVPDKWARAFLAYGIPVLALFGLLVIGAAAGHAGDGAAILTGSMR
jgi:hypothetical protein